MTKNIKKLAAKVAKQKTIKGKATVKAKSTKPASKAKSTKPASKAKRAVPLLVRLRDQHSLIKHEISMLRKSVKESHTKFTRTKNADTRKADLIKIRKKERQAVQLRAKIKAETSFRFTSDSQLPLAQAQAGKAERKAALKKKDKKK